MKVFINCPFDREYQTLLRYMIFTLLYLDQEPSIALGDSDCATKRIDKIERLISESDFSIHDLSRIKAKKKSEYARLNMPFELGIDYGISFSKNKSKKYLILENEKYSYQKGLSDYSGFYIYAHHNDPDKLVKILRDWFVNNRIVNRSTPGANKIYLDYFDCWGFIFDSLIQKGYSEKETDDIPINEYIDITKEWKKSISASHVLL
jgi:hypothetical protein